MSALNGYYAGNTSCSSYYSDALPFMKLNPKRVLTKTPYFPKTQIARVSDFRYGEARPIDATGNDSLWSTASFSQHEIA
jgi:predicted component of type VI protein secretion system